MKVGDKYKCIKSYYFFGICYFIEDRTYTIKDINTISPKVRIKFDYNEDNNENMFMFLTEMKDFFVCTPFKFGR